MDCTAGGGLFLATERSPWLPARRSPSCTARGTVPSPTATPSEPRGSGSLSTPTGTACGACWRTPPPSRSSPTAGPARCGPRALRPGERASLRIAVRRARESGRCADRGHADDRGCPSDWDLEATHELIEEAAGVLEVPLRAGGEGIVRLRVTFDGVDPPLETRVAPIRVTRTLPRVRWADLHGHSGLSDGTGTPDDWYRYAREVAGLDVAALTDHDHFGVRFLDEENGLWEELVATAARHHDPGAFVTLPAFEWTSWIHGHRHVLHFADTGPLLSSLDEATERPDQLWDALRGLPAITLAHHSSGDPIPTNWSFAPDPVLEPVTEIASVHGSSEAADGPQAVRGSRPGRYVRDQLNGGVQLGFVASGDGHDGHPGLAHRSPVYGALGARRIGTGGLAGLECEELDRASVLEALRARRTYATNGPRILLPSASRGRSGRRGVRGCRAGPRGGPAGNGRPRARRDRAGRWLFELGSVGPRIPAGSWAPTRSPEEPCCRGTTPTCASNRSTAAASGQPLVRDSLGADGPGARASAGREPRGCGPRPWRRRAPDPPHAAGRRPRASRPHAGRPRH